MAQSRLSMGTERREQNDSLFWTITDFKALYSSAKATKKNCHRPRGFYPWGKRMGINIGTIKERGIYLHYFGSDCVSAEYTGYLKTPGGQFTQVVNVELKKYTPKAANVEGASESWGRKFTSMSQLENKGFLTDDTLQLKLNVSVYSGALLKLNASRDFIKLLESGLGADVTFTIVEGIGSQKVIGVVKAHRAFLIGRSSVFATMFASGMVEATDGQVKIEDISPEAFRILLKYIYFGEIDGDWGSVAEEMFYCADKYDLMELREYLCQNVDAVLTVQNVLKIRDVATLYNLPPSVLESTVKFVESNAKEFLENLQE